MVRENEDHILTCRRGSPGGGASPAPTRSRRPHQAMPSRNVSTSWYTSLNSLMDACVASGISTRARAPGTPTSASPTHAARACRCSLTVMHAALPQLQAGGWPAGGQRSRLRRGLRTRSPVLWGQAAPARTPALLDAALTRFCARPRADVVSRTKGAPPGLLVLAKKYFLERLRRRQSCADERVCSCARLRRHE